jgi:hypothetical protein
LENAESQGSQLKNENAAQETTIDQFIDSHRKFNTDTYGILNGLSRLIDQKFRN